MASITLKCKSCGSKITIDSLSNRAVCDYCGNPYEIPQNEIRDELLNLYSRADNAWEHRDFDEALELYERIIREDNNQAQAHFAAALCRYGISYEIDPGNGRKVPTCNRFNRTSILDDKNYQMALKFASEENRASYQKTGTTIDKITGNFLKIVDKEAPYDVFISYKRTDARNNLTEEQSHARKLYYYLTERKYKVFFSEITLQNIAGENYEPYIFAALTSAPVMVLMGSSRDNMESTWVRNEWKRFLTLESQGEDKTLIPCCLKMDPYNLPGELRAKQSMDVGSYTFLEDITAIIGKKLMNAKRDLPETTGNTLMDKYAPRRKIQILMDKLDCDAEHAAEVLVFSQGNVESSLEYIQKEEDYKKSLWICAECGTRNTHDVCRNSACGLQKAASLELTAKREDMRRNSEKQKRKMDKLRKLSNAASVADDVNLPIEERIARTESLLRKKRDGIWRFALLITVIYFIGSVSAFSNGSAAPFVAFFACLATMFMTAVYSNLASPEPMFGATLLFSGGINLAAFLLLLLILNNPLVMVLTIIGNVLSALIGADTDPLFREGTAMTSLMITAGLNYVVIIVQFIRLKKLRKSLKGRLQLLKNS